MTANNTLIDLNEFSRAGLAPVFLGYHPLYHNRATLLTKG